MGIVVIGSAFVDIKGYPLGKYIPTGRNAGRVETVHGGVARNVAENIANVELRPTFLGLVDETGTGTEVIEKLKRHKVDTRYIKRTPDGMGTWLVIFDNSGDISASISKRPDLLPLLDVLEESGDEIFSNADSIVVEIDLEKEIIKKAFELAKKYEKRVYAVVSNMSIALERRDFLKDVECFVCNESEAGILFMEEYEDKTTEEAAELLVKHIKLAGIKKMVVTLGARGAVYADCEGDHGVCPAKKVDVRDTAGAGDAFFSGVTIGLTYGKTLFEACEIGTKLSAAVITSTESVCPRFLPTEFGLPDVTEE